MRGDRTGRWVFRIGCAYRGEAAYASKARDHSVRGAAAKAEALIILFLGSSLNSMSSVELTEDLRIRTSYNGKIRDGFLRII